MLNKGLSNGQQKKKNPNQSDSGYTRNTEHRARFVLAVPKQSLLPPPFLPTYSLYLIVKKIVYLKF